MTKLLSFLSIFYLFCACKTTIPFIPPTAVDYTDAIRLNQVGYYPNAPKKAVISQALAGNDFQVFDLDKKKQVFAGKLSATKDWKLAGEQVRIADFSKINKNGRYTLFVKGVGYSYPFEIKENVLNDALTASMKSFYYQRLSMPIEEKYAGKWHRKAGHSDDKLSYHPSTGKEGTISMPGAWYDAGDFGKYVVNGSFSLGQMLFLHEQYPQLLKDGSLIIQESGNGVSDLLDELKYEMDWLLKMQDEDGGLFFKVTSKKFTGLKMPHQVGKVPRFVIGKSTTASLDFAAVAAKFYRAYKDIDTAYANQCLVAAKKAWDWAVANPKVYFTNPEDVKTGEYGDKFLHQEFFWAAAELYVSTKDKKYLPTIENYPTDFDFKEGESWANYMGHLGAYTLLENTKDLPKTKAIQNAILSAADKLAAFIPTNDYLQPVDDFQWGSNSDVMNAAMILAHAYRINPKPTYLSAIQETTDYIFGKNAQGLSFVTGYGTKYPLHLHHRQSVADGIEDPVPGFISGGPNFGKHDAFAIDYPENAPPMKCWVDHKKSFASNEVCLNWNAALTYVLGFLEEESEK